MKDAGLLLSLSVSCIFSVVLAAYIKDDVTAQRVNDTFGYVSAPEYTGEDPNASRCADTILIGDECRCPNYFVEWKSAGFPDLSKTTCNPVCPATYAEAEEARKLKPGVDLSTCEGVCVDDCFRALFYNTNDWCVECALQWGGYAITTYVFGFVLFILGMLEKGMRNLGPGWIVVLVFLFAISPISVPVSLFILMLWILFKSRRQPKEFVDKMINLHKEYDRQESVIERFVNIIDLLRLAHNRDPERTKREILRLVSLEKAQIEKKIADLRNRNFVKRGYHKLTGYDPEEEIAFLEGELRSLDAKHIEFKDGVLEVRDAKGTLLHSVDATNRYQKHV